MARSKEKLVAGTGLNDVEFSVTSTAIVNGKMVRVFTNRLYQTWSDMIKRCYAKSTLKSKPSYIDCCVCDEWLKFSNFYVWAISQDWDGKSLDKDLLVKGNKVYSPETCVFIEQSLNSFISSDLKPSRGMLTGASYRKDLGKFRSRCGNPFTGKVESIGFYLTENEAHEAWRKRKHELACQLADSQDDPRVAAALRKRYLPSGLTS